MCRSYELPWDKQVIQFLWWPCNVSGGGKAEIYRINKTGKKASTRWNLPRKFHLCQRLWKNKQDLNIMGGCKRNHRSFHQLFCTGTAGSSEHCSISSWTPWTVEISLMLQVKTYSFPCSSLQLLKLHLCCSHKITFAVLVFNFQAFTITRCSILNTIKVYILIFFTLFSATCHHQQRQRLFLHLSRVDNLLLLEECSCLGDCKAL